MSFKMKNSLKIFKALSDKTRLRIFNLLLLTDIELNGKTIASALCIPQYAVSRHILILINSDLLKKRREAQNIFFSISSFTEEKREDFLKFFDSLFQDSAKFREDLQRLKEVRGNDIDNDF